MKSITLLLLLTLCACGTDEKKNPGSPADTAEFNTATIDLKTEWQNHKISEWRLLKEIKKGDNIYELSPELDKAFWANAVHAYDSNFRKWGLSAVLGRNSYLGHHYLFNLEVTVDAEGVITDIFSEFFDATEEELLALVEARNQEWQAGCENDSKAYSCTKFGSEGF